MDSWEQEEISEGPTVWGSIPVTGGEWEVAEHSLLCVLTPCMSSRTRTPLSSSFLPPFSTSSQVYYVGVSYVCIALIRMLTSSWIWEGDQETQQLFWLFSLWIWLASSGSLQTSLVFTSIISLDYWEKCHKHWTSITLISCVTETSIYCHKLCICQWRGFVSG